MLSPLGGELWFLFLRPGFYYGVEIQLSVLSGVLPQWIHSSKFNLGLIKIRGIGECLIKY